MPSSKLLKAATTPAEPGTSAGATRGLASVFCIAAGEVVGGCVSVLFCGAVGLVEFVFVVRGRMVVDEFVFWAMVISGRASTSKAVSKVLCGITTSTSFVSNLPGIIKRLLERSSNQTKVHHFGVFRLNASGQG